ncbi:asparagine synthase (glutamine-hydrolyzing) [Dyella acidiphila]|uniref:asparagine synthase (glutamine-hydrolyzing) n=1 Tax=Dyella acidiphila TaxID=2775866 RepID=A0ABR9G4Y4_9GAMM|nr:asparagine synthase (glutamine-hydrolyzing) [Dyella acidiphila]MBE1159084.1 asparagine synthase (glutamine-hydrolyzing) [Dyella acidiphila]
MCGIAGLWNLHATEPIPHAAQKTRGMLRAMAHRGPQGDAFVQRGPLCMASNRLAIRGVDQHQPPLLEHEAGIVVACNGEIDNHRLLRRSLAHAGHCIAQTTDIAVIAPLYLEKGLRFLEHLHGVFALALWDERAQRLILARDRAGERHLYYARTEQGIYFASELAALLGAQTGTQLDRDGIARYLRSGYCAAPGSLVKNHYKLSPGEVIVFDRHGERHQRYWDFPNTSPQAQTPAPAAFDPVFRNAVQRQSDIDVDYGVLLSGGIDSALMTAVVRDLRPQKKISAYCIRFAESSFDEGGHAAEIAARLGCEFVPVTVAAGDVPGTLRELITATGEPLADPAWIPLSLVTRRAAQDVRLLLAGEGADELFGGYPTYLGVHWSAYYTQLPRPLRALAQKLIEQLPTSDKKVTLSFLLKRFVRGQELDGLARHLLWTANIPPPWLQRLGITPPSDDTTHHPARLIDALQRYDFAHSLPDALMAKADRGGMLHGVEIRAPFLDQAVIEFAATLPLHARIRGFTTKAFLKDYARQYLPEAVVTRRKRGLSVPLAYWLREPLHGWAQARLSSNVLAQAGINTDAALELLAEHQARLADHSRAIWTLLVLSEWLSWFAQLPREPATSAAKVYSDGV